MSAINKSGKSPTKDASMNEEVKNEVADETNKKVLSKRKRVNAN
jgi:hypothetical protein